MLLKRIIATSFASAAVLAAGWVIALPANAAGEIYDLSASNLHVDSGACRNVSIAADYDNFGSVVDSINMQVWQGATNVDNELLIPSDNSGTVHDYWLWCPYMGVGTFQLGPSEVDYHDPDTYESGSQMSDTTATVVIKQATSAAMTVSRVGRYVNVKARLRFFSVDDDTWHYAAGARLSLQKRNSLSSAWTTVAHATTNANAIAYFSRQYARTARYWRVTFAGTSRSWNATSGQVKK